MSAQMQLTVESLRGLGDEGFVQKAYLTLLGRAADPTGFRDYLGRLRAGVQRTQIWSELASSDEAKRYAARQPKIAESFRSTPAALSSVRDLLELNGEDFVRQAYWSVLGREADPVGMRDYTNRLVSGSSKRQIVADLRCDPEGQAFASKLKGLDDLVKQVQAPEFDLQQLRSVDDVIGLQGELFVRGAYLALFKREPDSDGYARYLGLLKSGVSKTFILIELSTSAEAQEKDSQLIGLPEAVAVYKKAQRKSWGGWYCRNVLGAESDLPADRERRALAYRLTDGAGA